MYPQAVLAMVAPFVIPVVIAMHKCSESCYNNTMKQETCLTVKIPLYVDDITPFVELLEKCRDACNYVSEQVSYLGNDEEPAIYSGMQVQNKFYRDVRERFGLKAQLAILVCWQVADNYKTFNTQIEDSKREVERWEQRKAKAEAEGRHYGKRKPKVIKWHALVYRKLFCRMSHKRCWSFKGDGIISINTLGERMKCRIPAEYVEKYKDCEYGEGRLSIENHRVVFSFTIKQQVDVPETADIDLEKAKIVGCDIGQRNLYVSYDGENTTFCSGGLVKDKRVHAAEKRSELQKVGTPSSKRRIKSLAKSENRFVEEVNHSTAKALLSPLKRGDVLVLEDLSGLRKSIWVRKRDRYLRYSWSYSSLRQKIEYKAEQKGVIVWFVKPDDTSITCPVCGEVKTSNRNHKTHEYRCGCGYRGNDDRTAAMNIRQRGIDEIRQIQSAEGSTRKRRGDVMNPGS